MAKHLASIHGTEEDKVNCPFYFKIGACRHSDRCSRLHHKPAFSQTLLIKHIYQHPIRLAELQAAAGMSGMQDKDQAIEDFLCFWEDMYMEFSKFGRVEAIHIVDNLGDHMIGNVYAKFFDEEEASDALQAMNGRYYDGRLLNVEFSPVTDFREARCRDYDEEQCSRGGFCNFLHVKPVPGCLMRSLEEDVDEERRRKQDQEREERRRRKRHRDDDGGSRRSRESKHRRHRSDSD
jgi:splicing factor U2AF subunit